ncbi:MAG: S8 family peptidase [Verrucomicrobiota bacterium]
MTIKREFSHLPGVMVLNAAELIPIPPAEQKVQLLTIRNALFDSGQFEYVEPDYLIQAAVAPSDGAFQDGTIWALPAIQAPQAWDLTTGATNLIVAVIDSGLRATHQDLAGQLWTNPAEIPGNGIDDDGDGYVDDVHGINALNDSGDVTDENSHGSHVAGIIGAAANNGGPMVGVAWQISLLPCKFMDSSGSGQTSDAIECINYAVAHGARILNCSWGNHDHSQALFDALATARNAGVLVVAAAGNDAWNNDAQPMYPANYDLDNIISVGALNRNDELAPLSNYGRTTVDLAAPGIGIYSCGASTDTEYKFLDGTSMAAPHVTGVAALLLAKYPAMGVPELRLRLFTTTTPLPALAGRTVTGGRVNARQALSAQPDGFLEVSTASSVSPPLEPRSSIRLFVTVSDLSPVTDASVTGVIEDRFADRALLAGTLLSTNATNVGASKEAGEPEHAGNAGGRSVWWSWTPSESGPVTINTTGSSFDTLLAVYTGAELINLSPVATNDNQGFFPFSSVSFLATAGTPYQVAVDGAGGASGTIQLFLKMTLPPFNDAFVHRGQLSGSFVIATGSNENATKEPGEPLHAGNLGGKSVWWTWTAPSSGPVRIATTGSLFDTALGVYTGSAVDALTLVAGDDDSGGWPASAVTIQASGGTTYQIAVDGFNDGLVFGAPSGPIRLTISEVDRIRVLPPERIEPIGFRIWLISADGERLDASRVPRIGVHALDNLNQTPNIATKLSGSLTPAEGRWWLDDLTTGQLTRFYRVVEAGP